MSKRTSKRSDLLKRLSIQYRVVFINDDSLEEVASYKLTMRKLYILFSSLFVMVALVTLLLIMYTPLKYYIPGYAGGSTRSQIVRMKQRVDSLSDLVAAQEKYQQNMRNVITGDKALILDTSDLDMNQYKQQEMKSLLPKTEEIKKDALKKK